jgi:hypothetical protein
MQTKKHSIRTGKQIIFVAGLCLGIAAGILMNNFRSGIALGIATGLTGITGFLYYRESISRRHEKLKNTAIPVASHNLRKKA